MGTRGKASSTLSRPERWLAFGDTHVPFQDRKALRVIHELVREARPDGIIHTGDLIDAWQISRFDKDPHRKDWLQDNIDDAVTILYDLQYSAPRKAKLYYLEGNHEYRLTTTVARMSDAQRELARLEVFQEHINWNSIIKASAKKQGFKDFRWTFVPYRQQSRFEILPGLITKHGTVVRKWSGASARGEWERYGKSGMSGHVHRLGLFYHANQIGAHGWAETGCTCDLNPTYMLDPDWQHGAVIVTYVGDRWNFEPVYIQDGKAVWRDKLLYTS